MRNLVRGAWLGSLVLCTALSSFAAADATGSNAPGLEQLHVRISWGQASHQASRFYIKLLPAEESLKIEDVRGVSLETGDTLKDGVWQTRAGAGDVDGIDFTLSYPKAEPGRLQNLDPMWDDLIAQDGLEDEDTARRLSQDAAFQVKPPRFTLQMNEEGSKGFTLTVDQLKENHAIWIPSLDVYVTSEAPISFEDAQHELLPWKGLRIMDRVESEPEATYAQYASLWEDMGNPNFEHPNATEPGHIVGLTWDSAVHKFGIDRRAGVWNDKGSPDHFRFWLSFGDIGEGLKELWKSQSLRDGLPVMTTVFEKDHVRYEVEQFAYPLNGPPANRCGDIPMLLLERVKAVNLQGKPREVAITMSHMRELPAYEDNEITASEQGGATTFEDRYHRVLFAIQGVQKKVGWSGVREFKTKEKRVNATVFLDLPANSSSEFVVKLPSPMVEPGDRETLLRIGYDDAREKTLNFWSAYESEGAQFEVPEKTVNDLFRASLWHALMLPRRHGCSGDDIRIDLPYSNFAYQQTGTPWPVNQAVYLDYMLYDQRGYGKISAEELLAMYRNNQEYDGHINGNADWLSYTPGMLYAVAQHYLLSNNREELNRLLPPSMKTLDWSLAMMQQAQQLQGAAKGLVYAPVNDATGTGVWPLNQAYMFAGLNSFGEVLRETGNPEGQAAIEASHDLQSAIRRGFGHATMLSPLVQLRDHTWTPFFPSSAITPGRLLQEWYPTSGDTGAPHLFGLGALPATGEMADSLLNDQEDNLYYKGRGMLNEPVHLPQAMTYLLRDDPKAVIRDFYSSMACAFSHTVFEPVEHRWTHGQYFGPPSTDGSWFNLYRHMLIDELSDGTLFLTQAAPRPWMEDGKKIEVRSAPTYFGLLSFTMQSEVAANKIVTEIQMPNRTQPKALLLRVRHPESKPIRSVTVNGKSWTNFDGAKEWVRIEHPEEGKYTIVCSY